VSDSETVRALRRQLGHRLATARRDAGYAQREFARQISYARSTLSTVESGIQRAGRTFWQACDAVLGTDGEFELGYDRIRAQTAAERQSSHTLTPAPGQQDEGLQAVTLPEAMDAYWTLGWPATADGDVAKLVTGTVLDALEVPRTAGTLAASWWQSTGGVADQIRGLPALPDPRHALAAITCGGQSFFLAAAGSFPWAGQDLTGLPPVAGAPVVRWHSGGSPIPVPPGTREDGQQATWAYLPPGPIQLASPVMLLDLLAKAVAATATAQESQALSLPGGVQAVPALGGPPGPGQRPQP
jgi:transcriptional regulator with XRE-family HTH domain